MGFSAISQKFGQLASDLHLSSTTLAVIIDAIVIVLGLSIWYAMHKSMQHWEKRHKEEVNVRWKSAISLPIRERHLSAVRQLRPMPKARPSESPKSPALLNASKRMSGILHDLPNPWPTLEKLSSMPILARNAQPHPQPEPEPEPQPQASASQSQTRSINNIIESFPAPPDAVYSPPALRRGNSLATEFLGLPSYCKTVLGSPIYVAGDWDGTKVFGEKLKALSVEESLVHVDEKKGLPEPVSAVVEIPFDNQHDRSATEMSSTTLVPQGKAASTLGLATLTQKPSVNSFNSETTAVSIPLIPSQKADGRDLQSSLQFSVEVKELSQFSAVNGASHSVEKTTMIPEPDYDANAIRKIITDNVQIASVPTPHPRSNQFASFVVMSRGNNYRESQFKKNSALV